MELLGQLLSLDRGRQVRLLGGKLRHQLDRLRRDALPANQAVTLREDDAPQPARKRARRVVVSIFVNPTQFAANEDFGSYPRTFAGDLKALAAEKVDLVYIVLPQAHVAEAIRQCVTAKAGAACIITAGFSEASEKGRTDEDTLRKIAEQSGLLMAGPNTIGMVNTEVGMMGSFVNFPRWQSGGVSFFTQTGIFTGAVMLNVMSAATQRLPVGKSIDVGNKVDVDEVDFLDYAAKDPGTKVVGP